jgi:hypothetical protein
VLGSGRSGSDGARLVATSKLAAVRSFEPVGVPIRRAFNEEVGACRSFDWTHGNVILSRQREAATPRLGNRLRQ